MQDPETKRPFQKIRLIIVSREGEIDPKILKHFVCERVVVTTSRNEFTFILSSDVIPPDTLKQPDTENQWIKELSLLYVPEETTQTRTRLRVTRVALSGLNSRALHCQRFGTGDRGDFVYNPGLHFFKNGKLIVSVPLAGYFQSA